MEMLPQEARTYRHITHCALNASDNYTQVQILLLTPSQSSYMYTLRVRYIYIVYVFTCGFVQELLLSGTAEVSPIILENQVGRLRGEGGREGGKGEEMVYIQHSLGH